VSEFAGRLRVYTSLWPSKGPGEENAMKTRTTIGFGAVVAVILAVPAIADPIGVHVSGAATTFVQCSGAAGSGPVIHSQSCTGTAYGESATADLAGASARAAGTTPDGTRRDVEGLGAEVDFPGGASASVFYYFAVVPPQDFDPFVKVPVIVSAFLTTGITATEGDFLVHTFGRAAMGVSSEGIGELGKSVCSGDCSGQIVTDPGSTLDGSWTIDLFPQVTNEVFLSAQIELSSLFQSSASALADPYIQIDPSFLSTHPGFSVVVSDGVANSPRGSGGTSTVPEPATVWSLGFGLLALVGVARRNVHWRRD
jgi:hypothetical protein